jgi:peroxiredoxin
LRGIQYNLDKFHAAGIRPAAISVDSPETNRKLMEDTGITFTLLSDTGLDAIGDFDLVHAGAGEDGRSIARPAEFLLDASGTIRWLNLTENYWVRATPEKILEAAKLLQ